MTLPQDMSTRVVVIDTNIVLDLLLFAEPAVEPLRQALLQQRLRWLAIAHMRNELERVLQYPQIAPRMAFYGHSTEQLLQRMDAVVQYVEPAGPAGRRALRAAASGCAGAVRSGGCSRPRTPAAACGCPARSRPGRRRRQ